MDLSKIKLIALDLDGTLTQHKSKLTTQVKEILDTLSKDYNLVMVGAGSCERIFKQLNKYPIDIIGNYGMEFSTVDKETGNLIITDNIKVDVNTNEVMKKVEKLRVLTGYTSYAGESVEFHPSGAITFPLLGTTADKDKKLTFDPTKAKRRAILDLVKKEFNDKTVFIGGTSSFDITPKEFNKYIALKTYIDKLKINSNEVVYFGDDYGPGGNDEHLYNSEIEFIKVDNYKEFPQKVRFLIK